MTLEEAIFYKLSNTAPVSLIVSSRIYPILLPENTQFPCISYQIIFMERFNSMTGHLGTTTAQVQIDSWSKTATEARTLAKKVHNALNAFSGTINTLEVSCLSLSEQDFFESDVEVYRRMQEYQFIFTEQG